MTFQEVLAQVITLVQRLEPERMHTLLNRFFALALDIARSQQAKSLELRAAPRLCRLWQQQGKRAEAHALLAEVYNWFTEEEDMSQSKGGVMKRTLLLLLLLGIGVCMTTPLRAQDLLNGALTALGGADALA